MRVVRSLGTAVAAAALAACVSRPAPPAPLPAPIPRPVPAPPTPVPAPPQIDWQDAPLSPGDWTYRGGPDDPLAEFRSGSVAFSLRCDRGRSIVIGLAGVQGAAIVIRTSYGERRLDSTAPIPAADPLLDAIAFSRGRFLVRVEGQPDLILPTWPELARVVEDCRQ